MKTKLLKKVRKEYQIRKFTHINVDDWLYSYRNIREKDLPVFVVTGPHGEGCYGSDADVYFTYEDAFEGMLSLIKRRFRKRSKHYGPTKQEKIWYNPIENIKKGNINVP